MLNVKSVQARRDMIIHHVDVGVGGGRKTALDAKDNLNGTKQVSFLLSVKFHKIIHCNIYRILSTIFRYEALQTNLRTAKANISIRWGGFIAPCRLNITLGAFN